MNIRARAPVAPSGAASCYYSVADRYFFGVVWLSNLKADCSHAVMYFSRWLTENRPKETFHSYSDVLCFHRHPGI